MPRPARSATHSAPNTGTAAPLVPLAEAAAPPDDPRIGQYQDTIDFLQERLADLELAVEDMGWSRLVAEGDQEFSRTGLQRIMALSRLMFLKSPLINRATSLQALYVWSQGINITAKDDLVNEVIQAFLDDPHNQAELTSHEARIGKDCELTTTGNLFFVLFINRATGRVRLRTIPASEIQEILTNPEDAKEPWYYRRVWTMRGFDEASGVAPATGKIAYYPDWRYAPAAGQQRPPAIGGAPVEWDTPVYHVKVGALPDMRFGVPELYPALDWARAYKEFLEDLATTMRAVSRFAWNLKVPGGAVGVSAAKTKLATTLAAGSGAQMETNPPPVTGSTFISTPAGAVLDPIKANAPVEGEDGRRLLLMVAAAAGMPESFFGDVSVGTLATARSLDRPTELKFRARQQLWASVHAALLQRVVDESARAPKGALPGQTVIDPDEPTAAPRVELAAGHDRHIDVDFPPILEHDTAATVTSIVDAATLRGYQLAPLFPPKTIARLLLTTLGENDVDELLDELYDEDGWPLLPPEERAMQGQGSQGGQPGAGGEPPAPADGTPPGTTPPARGGGRQGPVRPTPSGSHEQEARSVFLRGEQDLREAVQQLVTESDGQRRR